MALRRPDPSAEFQRGWAAGFKAGQASMLSDPDADAPGAFHSDGRDTEMAAAYALTPRSGTQRRRVLDAIAAAGERGLTGYEVWEELGGRDLPQSVLPRITELSKGNWVHDSGDRRDTPAKASAVVWALTPVGRTRYRFTV